ncbi:MAG: protein-disulfide reductase DsbD domain-containing protein [Pseudomonadota bacterium]
MHQLSPSAWFLLAAPILVNSSPAPAGAVTDWHQTMGGNVRLVLESAIADKDGHLPSLMRGAIEIKLDEGWHTYWRDPGASGIPPMFQWAAGSDIQSATIHYPAPRWVDDAYGGYAGYTEPVSLPITFETDGRASARLEGSLLLGICEDICIPVVLPFVAEIVPSQVTALTDMVIRNAFDALPEKLSEDAVSVEFNEGSVKVTIAGEAGAETSKDLDALFVHLEGAQISYPKKMAHEGGHISFVAKVNSMPSSAKLLPMNITAMMGDKAYDVSIDVHIPSEKE